MIGLILLSFLVIGYWLLNKPPRLLRLGHFVGAKTLSVGDQAFYIEDVRFADYQAAIHGYFNLAPTLEHYATVQEVTYDFFDFFSVVYRFEHCTIKLVRQIDKVRLIKSQQPMSIGDFEQAIIPIAYRPL